jgi:hypothetical protein
MENNFCKLTRDSDLTTDGALVVVTGVMWSGALGTSTESGVRTGKEGE